MTPVRMIWASLGLFFVALGVVGIFIPGLPTTPFLLLALWCFARSSDRLYRWLLDHRVLGVFIRDYQEKRAIPLKIKLISLSTVALSLAITLWYHESWTVRSVVLVLGMTGVWVILRIPTLKKD